MLKFIFIVILYLLVQFSAKSQIVHPDIKQQCEFIGNAELSIIEENYTEAIANYRFSASFAPLDNNSTVNKIMCHLKMGDIDSSVNMAMELCHTGFPVSFFNRQKFKPMDTNSRWQEFKTQNINKVTYFENNRISKLLEVDQYIRHNDLGYDSTYTIQMALLDSTVKIIGEVGFNTRSVEGYKMHNDTFISGPDFTILIVHAFRIMGDKFKKYMLDALANGDINSFYFAGFIRYFDHYTNEVLVGCNNPLNAVFYQVGHIIYTCDDELKAKSDYYRKQLGLLPLADVMRLSEYYYEKSKDFNFNNLFSVYAKRSENILVKDHEEALTSGRIYKVLEEGEEYFK